MAFRRRQVDSMEERLWTGAGVFATYVTTQVILPRVWPAAAANDSLVDGGLMLGGTVLAVRDPGPMGAFAFGAAIVGAIPSMDRATLWIEQTFFSEAS